MASERQRTPVRRRPRPLLHRRASELSAKPRSAEQPTTGKRSTRAALQHGCWETTASPCGGIASTPAVACARHASGRFPQLLQREQPTPLRLPVAPVFALRLLQLFLPRRRRTGNTRRPGFSLRPRQDGGGRPVPACGRVPLFPYDQLGDWDAPRQWASGSAWKQCSRFPRGGRKRQAGRWRLARLRAAHGDAASEALNWASMTA